MKSGPMAITATALLTLMSLGAAAQAPLNLTGTWTGTAHDRFIRHDAPDGMRVTWVLTQTGSTVSGTVVSHSLVSNDGSCSACHREKTGTIAGIVSGTALTLTLDFPGHNGEVTSECTQTFNGSASGIAGNAFTLVYTGGDSCENLPGQTIAFDNGTLDVVREFTDDPLTTGSSVVRAIHTTELRARIDAVRGRFGLAGYPYTDLSAGTAILAQHITELRTALREVYVSAVLTPPTYTDEPLTAGTVMKAVHIREIRAAVLAIE